MKTKMQNKLPYESKEEMLMQFKEEKHPFLSGLLHLFSLKKSTDIFGHLLAWALLSCLLLVVSIFIF